MSTPGSQGTPATQAELAPSTAAGRGLALVAFGDVPDLTTALGAAVIAGGGLYVAWRERVLTAAAPNM